MSLYDVIPLPHDVIFHILQLGRLEEYQCPRCKVYHSVTKCSRCGSFTCMNCIDPDNYICGCCCYCPKCESVNVCLSRKSNKMDVIQCKVIHDHVTPKCSMKGCSHYCLCRSHCRTCPNNYCCKHEVLLHRDGQCVTCKQRLWGDRHMYNFIRLWNKNEFA